MRGVGERRLWGEVVPEGAVDCIRAVSYTHLDVYKRQAQDEGLAQCPDMGAVMSRMKAGALYNLGVEERTTADEAVADLIAGNCLLFFPGKGSVLSFNVGTEEKRSVSDPENETVLKGSRDSFVESLRTNTSLVRRHLKAPELRIAEQIVGRQSLTSVDVISLEGITDPDIVAQVKALSLIHI